MIKFQNVTKIYSPTDIAALKNISLEIKKGEFVSITGRSGSGKTTLMRLILGEQKPTQGQVFFEGKDIHKLKPVEISEIRRKIGVVFQDYKLLTFKTVYENVAYGLEVTGASEQEIVKNIPQVLEIVGLTRQANSFPSALSGGEKQRTIIARALIHRPDVIIADEPTGNLDPYHSWDIIRLLIKVFELGTTIILITHDKEIINSLKKRVITLDEGKIIRDEQEGRFAF